ncbi:MAG: MFS transporter [Kosmotoga sp.]|nr:MAG: MFS transporter [Kosmotoga sp.]
MLEEQYSKTKRLSLIESVLFNNAFILTQGFLLTGLALQFGVTESVLAVLGMLPVMAQVFQLGVPFLLRKKGSRKSAMIFSATISRPVLLLLPVMIFLGWKNQYVLVGILAIFAVFNGFTGNFWISLMRDIIPNEHSGRYHGLRNLLVSLFSMTMLFLYSLTLDTFNESLGFLIISIIGASFSLITYFILKRFEDPPRRQYQSKKLFGVVLNDWNFKRFLTFSFVWNFAIAMANPFFSYYQLVNLELSYSYLSVLSIIAGGVSILFYLIWGRLSDEIGHQSVAEFGIFSAAFTSIMWVFVNQFTAETLLPIDAILTGVNWSAINLALFTIMLNIVDPALTETYFALLAFVNGMGALAGALTGGFAATYLKEISFELFGIPFFGIQMLFIATGVLRMFSWLLLKRVKTRKVLSVSRFTFNTISVLGRRGIARPYGNSVIISRLKNLLVDKPKQKKIKKESNSD